MRTRVHVLVVTPHYVLSMALYIRTPLPTIFIGETESQVLTEAASHWLPSFSSETGSPLTVGKFQEMVENMASVEYLSKMIDVILGGEE